MDPVILNIETSTDICSVCIAQGQEILSLRETPRSYSHSEVITIFVQECLKSANLKPQDLAAVAVSDGPGSYTALRISSATAKGLCYALDIPMIAIGALDALAGKVAIIAADDELIIPMIDARRKEVYRAVYDSQLQVLEPVAPFILDEGSFQNYKSRTKIHFCGDGAEKAEEILSLENGVYHKIEASAKYLVPISREKFANNEFVDIAYYEPNYYKGANITVQKKNILR